MRQIIKTIILVSMFISLIGCTKNTTDLNRDESIVQQTKGLALNFKLGDNVSTVRKEFKTGELKEWSNYYYMDIGNDRKIVDKYPGTLMLFFDKESKNLKMITFSFNEEIEYSLEEFINDFINVYGEPIHSENYNDKRKAYSNFVWYLDDMTYMHLRINNETYTPDYVDIKYRNLDYEYIAKNKLEQINKVISEDEELKELYDLFLTLLELSKGTSIEDAIDVFGVEYKLGGNFINGYTRGDLVFGTTQQYFDMPVDINFIINDPRNKDLHSRFDGEIQMTNIEIKNTPENIECILDTLKKLFGDYIIDNSHEYTEYIWEHLPFDISVTCYHDYLDNDIHIFISEYLDYIFESPTFSSDTNVEYIAGYKDVDESITVQYPTYTITIYPEYFSETNNDDNEKLFDINKSTLVTDKEVRVKCWTIAEKEIKERLKSPSSAKFPFSAVSKDVYICQSGNLYCVASWVKANNSFGTMIKSNFAIIFRLEGEKYTIYDYYIE